MRTLASVAYSTNATGIAGRKRKATCPPGQTVMSESLNKKNKSKETTATTTTHEQIDTLPQLEENRESQSSTHIKTTANLNHNNTLISTRPPLQDITSDLSEHNQRSSTPAGIVPQKFPLPFNISKRDGIRAKSFDSEGVPSENQKVLQDGQNLVPYCEFVVDGKTYIPNAALKLVNPARRPDRQRLDFFPERHGDLASRLLRRCLDGTAGMPLGGFHYGDWKAETRGFYSGPNHVHELQNSTSRPTMPFCVASFNRLPVMAIGDEAGGVRLLATQSRMEASHLKGSRSFSTALLGLLCHENAIFDISLSEDDSLMATASGDQTVRIFDLVRQECIAVLSEHSSSVKQVAFNPMNPKLLLTSSRDSNVHFWDLRVAGIPTTQDGEAKRYRPVNSIEKAHSAPRSQGGKEIHASVTAAIWGSNPEFNVMTACEANAIIKVWDVRSIRRHPRWGYSANKHVDESALPPHHNFNPNRNYGITSLSLSPNRDRIYTLCKDSTAYAYSTTHISNGPLHAYAHESLRTTSFYVKSSLSRDGRLLATGSTDGSVVLFPTDERYLNDGHYGTSTASFPWNADDKSSALKKEMVVGNGTCLNHGHRKEVTGIAWGAEGSLVSISDDLTARLWREGYIGQEAHDLREGGDDKDAQRWGCGWADCQ